MSVVLAFMVKVAPFLLIPCAFFCGIQISLISDFGLMHTVRNIRLNPEDFATQYAWSIVAAGWASVASAFICILVAVVQALSWFLSLRTSHG